MALSFLWASFFLPWERWLKENEGRRLKSFVCESRNQFTSRGDGWLSEFPASQPPWTLRTTVNFIWLKTTRHVTPRGKNVIFPIVSWPSRKKQQIANTDNTVAAATISVIAGRWWIFTEQHTQPPRTVRDIFRANPRDVTRRWPLTDFKKVHTRNQQATEPENSKNQTTTARQLRHSWKCQKMVAKAKAKQG